MNQRILFALCIDGVIEVAVDTGCLPRFNQRQVIDAAWIDYIKQRGCVNHKRYAADLHIDIVEEKIATITVISSASHAPSQQEVKAVATDYLPQLELVGWYSETSEAVAQEATR